MTESWFNKWGSLNLFGPGENDDSDNGVLFLAYWVALNGEMSNFSWALYFAEPGLQMRSPIRPNDTEAWDNQLGMCYLAPTAATWTYQYGKTHNWYYDCTHKAKFSLSLWRQPSQQYVICKASHNYAGFMRWIWFIAALFICSFHNEKRTSEILTQWLSNEIVKSKTDNPITKFFIRFFEKRIINKFGSFSNVFKIYFPGNHPIITLADSHFAVQTKVNGKEEKES